MSPRTRFPPARAETSMATSSESSPGGSPIRPLKAKNASSGIYTTRQRMASPRPGEQDASWLTVDSKSCFISFTRNLQIIVMLVFNFYSPRSETHS